MNEVMTWCFVRASDISTPLRTAMLLAAVFIVVDTTQKAWRRTTSASQEKP